MLKEQDEFYRELGQRISNERSDRKFSQEQLAEHLKLTRTSVANLERGRHRPSIYQLIQIATFLRVEYTILIPFDGITQESPTSVPEVKIFNGHDVVDDATKDMVSNFLSNINKE